MLNRTKSRLVCAFSVVVLDVGAPLAATLAYFPVWIERSAGATVSGSFLVLALLSLLPLFFCIKRKLRTPAVWVMWTLFFVLLVCLRGILTELIVIAGVGATGNLLGAIVYKYGERLAVREVLKK